MNASENFKYIASLGECPSAFKEDSAKIKALRESIVDQNTLSKEQVECCLDILDSATILTDMLFPFQAAVGLITKYRGVELFNFNQIFNCEPISSLDLYKFLIRLSETNRRSIINRLTPNDENRGLLNLALESNKPQMFLPVFAKSRVNRNILMGLYGLNYGINFSQKSLDEIESDLDSFDTAVRFVFSQHEQMFHDLANIPADEDIDILIEPMVSILKNGNFEGDHFEETIAKFIKIRKRLSPITFRKVCRYITYCYVLGFYMAYDQRQFTNVEWNVINQILNRNQFNNYGSIIRRKCRMMQTKIDAYNQENLKFNSLRNKKPEIWQVLDAFEPFINESIEKDKNNCIQSEIFQFILKNPDMHRLQQCIYALASWGYIDDNLDTKRLLYYRLSGFARPSCVKKIEWHKDINALFLLIKSIYGKSKGKYEPIKFFFDVPDYKPELIGNESAYADRVQDENVKELLKHLFEGNS